MSELTHRRSEVPDSNRVKVWPDSRRDLLRFCASLLLAVLATGSVLIVPLVVGRLIESISDGSPDVSSIIVMVIIVIGSSIGSSASTILVSKFAVSVVESARNHVMAHSLRLPMGYVRHLGVGRFLNLVSIDSGRLRNLVDSGLIQLVVATITVFGTLAVMLIIDWTLVVITLCSFAVAAVIVIGVITRVRAHHLVVQKRTAELSEDFSNTLRSLTVIKAYREEVNVAGRLARRTSEVSTAEARAATTDSLMAPAIVVAQQVALVSVVTIGAARVANESISMGSFIAFILYLLQLTGPLIMGASGLSNMQTGLVSRRAVDAHLSVALESGNHDYYDESGLAKPCDSRLKPAGSTRVHSLVEMEDVSFSYNESLVLARLTLSLPFRGITAIVGPSGSGKSTVLSVIERFVDIDSGIVKYDGQDISKWDLNALRSSISFLNQESSLVDGTVRENLTLGVEVCPSENVLWNALSAVSLLNMVQSLPGGLDTRIGGSVELSGGERQRLALARVFVVDRPLVLLDEPTSSVDSDNERKIVEALRELSARCSVVVVTHKAAMVACADQVITVESGRVRDLDYTLDSV
ncbi:ABC transporter ATP-binding protein [Rhodococcus sp. NPDC057135]|uniref:ABC transporter ATP-binding protein n=1 Tax=Rhodococcus sp. NPDC057135 TaxID=3346028 RepID=UPI003636B717